MDVTERYDSGEIDGTAYVYTEGMPDWALLSDIPHFSRGKTLQSAKLLNVPTQPENTAKQSSATAESPLQSEGIGQVVPETPEPVPLEKQIAAAAATNKGTKTPRWLFWVLPLLALLAIAGIFLAKSKPTNDPERVVVESDPPSTTTPVAASTDTPVAKSEFPWGELLELRNSDNRNGAPYRIASKHLGNLRPILVGAVSPLLGAESLALAIYPDPEKNLYALPRVWFLKVPVVDGLFTVGPLTLDGAELPPGTYHIMARAFATPALTKDFLGEITFDLGQWPANSELNQRFQNIQAERKALSEKEKGALQSRLNQILAASEELQKIGKALTPEKSSAWKKKLRDLQAVQANELRGASFYPEIQRKIYAQTNQLAKLSDAVFVKAKNLGQLWAKNMESENQLIGEVQSATGRLELKLDPQSIQAQLVEMK